jgi:hypothetical protein
VSPNPYAGSGQGVAQLRTIKASRQWGKRHYNLTGATCSPVTITDRHGNTRVVAPLVRGQVVRLARKSQRAVMAGERNLSPDLTEAEQDAILAQLRANAPKREKAFNIHDK